MDSSIPSNIPIPKSQDNNNLKGMGFVYINWTIRSFKFFEMLRRKSLYLIVKNSPLAHVW